MTNAARELSTTKWSYELWFSETPVEDKSTRFCTRHEAGLITYSESKACWTCKLSPLHIASPATHHIEIGFTRRHCAGSCVSTEIETQIGIFGIISLWKAICVSILLCVSFFLISVNKLWDMIICLCKCKGRTHHENVLESKAGCQMSNTLDFCLRITVLWES